MIVPQRITPYFEATPADAPTFAVIGASNSEVVHHAHAATSADVDQAVNTCFRQRKAWRETSIKDRCTVVSRAADLIEDESTGWKKRLLEANRAEIDISDFWSSVQVDEIIVEAMRALVTQVEPALASFDVEETQSTIHVTREPFGVCLAIAPWNTIHPLVMRAICNPLLAGNTVVMKTSESAPLTQYLWVELLYEAGLMPGTLCVVHVDPHEAPALVKQLVQDFRVRHVNFCGSERTGSIIAGLAGAALKPIMLELGGKAPALVLPDADFDSAASHLIFGAFYNAGQICLSTERILVGKSQSHRLVKAIQSAWSKAPKGKTRRLFTRAAAERVNGLVANAEEHGAVDILSSGMTIADPDDARDESSSVVTPSILCPITPKMDMWSQETFGPTSGIIPIDDEGLSDQQLIERMIEIANDSEYGLTASIWSSDVKKAQTIASQLECGAVHINQPTGGDPPLVPHGGWKSSGWGRFNGIEGIRTFTQTRAIETPKGPSQTLPIHLFGL